MSPLTDKILADGSWRELPTARIFRSLGDLAADERVRGHAHHARRFEETVPWNAVLTVNDRPSVYLLNVTRRDLQKEAELHRSLWNQGVANLLVVTDDLETRIYSAFAKPKREAITLDGTDSRLVESLGLADFALQTRAFALRLETGAYYRDHARSFSEHHHVDRYLLQNLRDTRNDLHHGADGLNLPDAHALLGRILFICYLNDRGIIGERQFADAGAPNIDNLRELFVKQTPIQARTVFFKLLRLLKDDFNGSMFDTPTREDERSIAERHIRTLGRFLAGEEVGSGQMTLGFSAYDFGLIPVETISGIYEEFLGAESSDKKREDGAFYTPKRLAELTADIATAGWPGLLGRRVLDPSCGSGIFLVLLFSRMAEEWRHQNPKRHNRTRADALRLMLTHHLCGIDVNLTACRIAAFSLYVAFLDQFTPRDLDEVKASLASEGQKVLPPLLHDTGAPSSVALGGLHPANFFTVTSATLGSFDLIIGNPPWIGRNQAADIVMEKWVSEFRARYTSPLLGRKKAKRLVFLPQDQSSHAFMWKVSDHLNPAQGRACLILPSKVWLNEKTNPFQSHWSRSIVLDEVVQLADSRRILFEDANCPATIARFHPGTPAADHSIAYIVPKVDVSDPGEATIVVLPEDRKTVTQAEWQKAADGGVAPILWKKRFWGTLGDERLIDRLLELPPLNLLAGPAHQKKRWLKGQGFQPNTSGKAKNPKKKFWLPDQLYLDANSDAIDLAFSAADCVMAGNLFSSLRRSPDHRIYQAPMVLVSQGFTKIAYADFSVLFQDSLQAIKGPPEDADLLMFLAGVLGSKFARYFVFHTSANWGVEREKAHFSEVLRLPFPLPSEHADPEEAHRIIREVVSLITQARKDSRGLLADRINAVTRAKAAIDPLVFRYYGLTPRDILLVEDTINVVEPSVTPTSIEKALTIPTLRPTATSDRLAYARLLCSTINRWAQRSSIKLNAEVLVADSSELALVVLNKVRQAQEPIERTATAEIQPLLSRIHRTASTQHGAIAYHRGFALFDEECILILKPLALRHWTATSALNDAERLVSAMLG